jgi:hypothetical protein
MAALAADANASTVGAVRTQGFSCNAADTFYRGSLVYIDTAGGVQVTFATGDIALGYSPKQQVTTAAAQEVEVVTEGFMWLPVGTNVAAADEGDWLINDGPTNTDNPGDLVTAGDITLASGDMICGRILRVTSSQMLIYIGPMFMGCVYFTNGTPANYSGWGLELA